MNLILYIDIKCVVEMFPDPDTGSTLFNACPHSICMQYTEVIVIYNK